MRIVIATPILYSPTSPFNHLFKDIIGGFLEAGNQVVRLVAVENENETEYKYGYEGKNIEYKLYKRKSSDHGNIISRYVRDTLTNIREAIGILKLKNVDVLFEDVSYSSFWAVKAAKMKGIKVVAMLQDVWPDNAVQSHLISEGSFLYKYFEMWQKSVYKNADKLICISDDMKDFIVSKGVDADKIEVIYNWGYSDDVVDIPWEENEFVKKYNLSRDKFYAIYAGNIGKMQNVEIVVNAAKELQDREDIQFLIIGDGARREAIEEMASGLKNVTMLPMQPSELATHIYSAAGVNIIPLVAGGTKTAMPSKTGVVLSCGKPVIFTFGSGSRFAKKVMENKAGASVNPTDYTEFAHLIRDFSNQEFCSRKEIYKTYQSLFARSKNIGEYVKVIMGNESIVY
ncbi:glycosyltransferase family 4 protein [Coprococcus catus]